MRSSDLAATVARRWVDAWTSGDRPAADTMLAGAVGIECNLGWSAERATFLDVMGQLAAAIDDAVVLSLTTTDRRAALLYECRLLDAAGSIRMAEFLDLDGERVTGVRRVYDLTAVDQLLPGLRGPGAS